MRPRSHGHIGRKDTVMGHHEQRPGINRRSFLKRASVITVGSIAARGVYEVLDQIAAPQRAEAATVIRRFQEQYLIDQIEVIVNNGVTVGIPPLHNDVFTAKLKGNGTWTSAALKNAKTRLENALAKVEAPYPSTAAGLTMVVGWGLPYFSTFVPTLWSSYRPAIPGTSPKQYAVLDAIPFPSDPVGVVMEDNHVMFKFRSDSPSIVSGAEAALFDNPNSGAYIGDLFDLTSKRIGFAGRGFGSPSIAKTLAIAAGVPGADKIPDAAQLMMGFTSTQTQALGPSNIPSFETLPGVTDQWPNGYFAAGTAMHLSHLYLDINAWYNSTLTQAYGDRVQRMFSAHNAVPSDPSTVTIANGPAQVSTMAQVKQDASSSSQVLGHNALLQQATRLPATTYDNYGRRWAQGTPVPLREDFNTLDNPFSWAPPGTAVGPTNTPGLHFVAFVPGHQKFHAARLAMDGVMPDGTNFSSAPYNIPARNMGINGNMTASHRQNYVIPPRRNRSFPLVELLK
ncbi:MAG: hypothetical protein JOZ81_25585 [Chloroflexi bacterium]|nr:hypothetical protein [Chloroflexota bacterium]